MSSYVLPVDEFARQGQTNILETVSYDYTLEWNSRDEAWYFRITTTGSDYEMDWVKLRVGIDLLAPYKYLESVPNGWLLVIDTVRSTGRVGRDDLGIDKRFQLWYITSDDEANELLTFYTPQ